MLKELLKHWDSLGRIWRVEKASSEQKGSIFGLLAGVFRVLAWAIYDARPRSLASALRKATGVSLDQKVLHSNADAKLNVGFIRVKSSSLVRVSGLG